MYRDNNEALNDEVEAADDAGTGLLPMTPDEDPTRGACKQIKTSRIVCTTRQKIRIIYNEVSRPATTPEEVHSLLVHDIGAIIRTHCPMDTGYWRSLSSNKRKDLIDEIMDEMLVIPNEYLVERVKEQHVTPHM